MKIPDPVRLPSGNYNIRMRLGGENISITCAKPSECIMQARLLKAEYLAGRRLQNAQKVDANLGEIMDAYIESRANVLSPSTINGYKIVRNNRFRQYINKKPSAIKDWQAVISDEVSDGVGPKTIKNAWGLLSAALSSHGYKVPNVSLPEIVPSPHPYLDADQIKTFIKAIHGHPCEIPALLALHSLRRSEILGLTWDRIDLEAGTIRIEGSAVIGENNKLVDKKTNKTASSRRTIPIMIPELATALKSVPEDKRKGKVYTRNPTLIYDQVNYICKKNHLPEVGVHGLRHSFASLALSSAVGMTEREVMEIGGWEDQQTMRKIYQHLSEKDRHKAENKFAAFFKNADENADKTSKHQ